MYAGIEEANPTVIEVFVSRLRRKLDDARAGVVIRVLRELGYRLEVPRRISRTNTVSDGAS